MENEKKIKEIAEKKLECRWRYYKEERWELEKNHSLLLMITSQKLATIQALSRRKKIVDFLRPRKMLQNVVGIVFTSFRIVLSSCATMFVVSTPSKPFAPPNSWKHI